MRIFAIIAGVGLLTALFSWGLPEKPQLDSPTSSPPSLGVGVFQSAPGPENHYLDVIRKRNIFGTKWEHDANVAAERSIDVPFDLVGTIATDDPRVGRAVLRHTKTGEVKTFRAGETVGESLTIAEVHREEIVLLAGRRRVVLQVVENELKVGAKRRVRRHGAEKPFRLITQQQEMNRYEEEGLLVEGNKIKVSETFIRHVTSSGLNETLGSALALPATVDGEVIGFSLTKIRSGSIFDKIGIREGDIVTEANGIPLRDVVSSAKTLQHLRGEQSAEFRILRDGRVETVEITIGP